MAGTGMHGWNGTGISRDGDRIHSDRHRCVVELASVNVSKEEWS
jgi:hypothetical protein